VSASKTPLTKPIHALPYGRIRIEAVVLDDGSCPAEEFLNGLDEEKTAKMKALFNLFIEMHPRQMSDQKFKKIEGTADLFEFKSFQIRMPCFFASGGRILLTHGLTKKQDRLPSSEITRAKVIKGVFERRTLSHG
jgi:hypothetical protein